VTSQPAEALTGERCPGSGQAPAGRPGQRGKPYAVYGGGCAACGAQVSVTPQWVIRPHYPWPLDPPQYMKGVS